LVSVWLPLATRPRDASTEIEPAIIRAMTRRIAPQFGDAESNRQLTRKPSEAGALTNPKVSTIPSSDSFPLSLVRICGGCSLK